MESLSVPADSESGSNSPAGPVTSVSARCSRRRGRTGTRPAKSTQRRIDDGQSGRTHVHGSSGCCLRPSESAPTVEGFAVKSDFRAALWAGAVRSALVPTSPSVRVANQSGSTLGGTAMLLLGHESVGYRRRWVRRPKTLSRRSTHRSTKKRHRPSPRVFWRATRGCSLIMIQRDCASAR